MRGGETRRLLRQSMRNHLPEQIRERTRLGVQGVDLCLRMAQIRSEIGDRLSELRRSQRLQRFLDVPRLERLWETWGEREKARPFAQFLKEQNILARGILTGMFVLWADSLKKGQPHKQQLHDAVRNDERPAASEPSH